MAPMPSVKPPQFKPLPDDEIVICHRVAAARRADGSSQAALAQKLGLTRNQLANIEAARVPLKYGIALKIHEILAISLAWLATGRPALPVCYSSDGVELLRALKPRNERILFSKAWASASPHKENVIAVTVPGRFESPEKNERKCLTNIPNSGNCESVQTEMDKLLSRVRKVTRERGKMAELAKFLNVKLAAVSEWLSDKSPREPGGEYALRILTWVENQERQQNSPGSVAPPPERKTRKKPSKYEKPKSSPP